MGFHIQPFSSFLTILKDENRHHTQNRHDISNSITYFQTYLGDINLLCAKFIVLEEEYINKDYLTDYAHYYIFSFKGSEYPVRCTRLHFFTYPNEDINAFEIDLEHQLLLTPSSEENKEDFWKKNYLGFSVITPIPSKIFGFTLLKHYNDLPPKPYFDRKRIFWGTKEYTIHLFGKEICLDSLGFQEQDTNVAACATIAIWTVFEIAAAHYNVVLKSPVEITKDAGIGNANKLLFPNEGLILEQMCNAIRANHLGIDVWDDEPHFNLLIKKLCHAYANLKIPIILAILIPTDKDPEGHAVAICGHKIEDWEPISDATYEDKSDGVAPSSHNITWFAERISKIYVHDDQKGPFSRMEFRGDNELFCLWSNPKNPVGHALIVSLYPKITITFTHIEYRVSNGNRLIHLIYSEYMGLTEADFPIELGFTWDIQLFHSEEYKKHIQSTDSLNNEEKRDKAYRLRLLTMILPEYIWVVKLYIQQKEEINWIFDASGLLKSPLLLDIWVYNKEISDILYHHLKNKLPHKFLCKYLEEDVDFITHSLRKEELTLPL